MKVGRLFAVSVLLVLTLMTGAQSVKEMELQKQEADKEIKETKAQLNANEKKVNQGLSVLRKLDDEIAVSTKEIETVKGQIEQINGNIRGLEGSISKEEAELKSLREEYFKAVKKMRVARKQNSGMAFLFSSGSFNQARRRMRYMKEFSDWKDRRSGEIKGKVATLQQQRSQLAQARNDATVALTRQQAAQEKLSRQRSEQHAAVTQLRANSDALKDKLAKRQAEARKLSNQISQLIAEQKAKAAREAEARKKADEEKRLAAEKVAAEKAERERLLAEEKASSKESKKPEPKKETKKHEATKEEASVSQKEEYAEARKRNRSSSTAQTPSETAVPKTSATPNVSGFESMKGSLPRPVGGSFKVVSAFGVHPISPELPDIMDENLGIDAHVAKGASAQAVYEGEVLKVYDRTNTPGFRNIVVLSHGDYITVYANLETLAVHTGQNVKQGQLLGTVGEDFDDPAHGMIHFEVWKNQTHLDPAAWIKR